MPWLFLFERSLKKISKFFFVTGIIYFWIYYTRFFQFDPFHWPFICFRIGIFCIWLIFPFLEEGLKCCNFPRPPMATPSASSALVSPGSRRPATRRPAMRSPSRWNRPWTSILFLAMRIFLFIGWKQNNVVQWWESCRQVGAYCSFPKWWNVTRKHIDSLHCNQNCSRMIFLFLI